jgi:hypothetical protein
MILIFRHTHSITLLFISLIFFLNIFCDAPRNNPLDPGNPDNNYYLLQGHVKTLSLPTQPLEGVTVFYTHQEMQTKTNSSGEFSLEIIEAEDSWLHFSQSGYLTDSVYVEWKLTKKVTTEQFLNALPQVESLQVYSVILNRYPSIQTEQVIVKSKITDMDNDIDSVEVVIGLDSIAKTLQYNVTDKNYERTLSIFDLGIAALEELVGHNFRIIVKDIFSHKFILDTGTIERVIRDEVIFQSPAGNEVTSPSPTLVWERFRPGFNFKYLIQIFSAEITPQLLWEKNEIGDDITQYPVDITLPPDEYFWVIWVIDEFGNRTRSKPASFTVE